MSGPLWSNGKRDAAEPEVIKALRLGGASVHQLSARDLPDLLVGYQGQWHTVEVKTGKAKLRPGQVRFAETCLGEPPWIARTAPQATKLLRLWSERAQSLSTFLRGARAAVGIESQPINGWDAVEQSEKPCRCDRCDCAGKDPEEAA